MLTDDTRAQLKDTLNATPPLARHLQTDVFYWYPPTLHFVFFFISSIMLLVGLTSSPHKRRYKSVLLVAALLSALALAMAFVAAIGSLQALNALVNGDKSKDAQSLNDDIFIYRAEWLDHFQAGQVSVVAMFYVAMGVVFARRQPKVGWSIFKYFQLVSGALKLLRCRL